jgi:hypothetical protein
MVYDQRVQSAIAVRPSYEHALVDVPVVPAPGSGHSNLADAAAALRRDLVSKIVDGLRALTGNAWVDYWNTEDRLDEFTHLLHALIAVTRAVGVAPDAEARQQAEAQRKVDEYLGDAAEQMHFTDATMDRAVRIVGTITNVAVPAQLQKDDAACAQRFNLSAKWYSLASATLRVIADEEEPAPRPLDVAAGVVESILVFARLAVLEAHHAVMEGARLRTPDAAAPEVQAAALEDFPDDFEEIERKIQQIEIH